MDKVYVVRHYDDSSEFYLFKDEAEAKALTDHLNGLSKYAVYNYFSSSYFESTNRYVTFYVSIDINCPQNIVTEFFGVNEGLVESKTEVFVGDIVYSFVQVPYIKGADLKKMAIDKFKKALEGTK